MKRPKAKGRRARPTQAANQPNPACEAVFCIPELCELIFCFLSTRNLLTAAQLVCTRWRDLILTSSPIQQRLQFKPRDTRTRKTETNAFLRKLFRPLLDAERQMPNNLYTRHHTALGYVSQLGMSYGDMAIADMRNGRKRHLAFAREGASWRRMLVAQPAPRRVGFINDTLELPSYRYSMLEFQILEFPDGLRMGQLYDLIVSIVWRVGKGNRESNRVGVFWNPAAAEVWPSYLAEQLFKKWTSEDQVDIIIAEVDGNGWWAHGSRGGRAETKKIRSTAWMFQCEEFEEPTFDLKRLQMISEGYGTESKTTITVQ